MGYTHYWRPARSFTDTEWSVICGAAHKVIATTKVALAAEYDEPKSKPIVDGEHIRFNGVGDDGHETFFLTKDSSGAFEFCKTAKKPYDVVVTAILAVAAAQGLTVSSDGTVEDWQPGLDLLASAGVVDIANPIKR